MKIISYIGALLIICLSMFVNAQTRSLNIQFYDSMQSENLKLDAIVINDGFVKGDVTLNEIKTYQVKEGLNVICARYNSQPQFRCGNAIKWGIHKINVTSDDQLFKFSIDQEYCIFLSGSVGLKLSSGVNNGNVNLSEEVKLFAISNDLQKIDYVVKWKYYYENTRNKLFPYLELRHKLEVNGRSGNPENVPAYEDENIVIEKIFHTTCNNCFLMYWHPKGKYNPFSWSETANTKLQTIQSESW